MPGNRIRWYASESAGAICVAGPQRLKELLPLLRFGGALRVYGPNLATVVGTSTEKGKDKDGKQFSRSFGWIDTWMERNGKWQCIGEAVLPLPEKK